MSKSAQERGTEEGPAVAKPRSACLVSRNPLSARQTSSLDSGASNVSVNQELGRNSVSGSTPKLARDGKSGKKMIRVLGAQGHLCRVVCVSVQVVVGHQCEGSKTNLQGLGWITTVC